MPQEVTHTAGPWEVLDDGMEVREVRLSGYFIASTYALPGGLMADENVPQRRANARLIAAAPDLLASLKAIIDGVDEVWMIENPGTVDVAQTAIDKAEGR